MKNSTSRSGGIPVNSSGKTSGKSRTTGTFSIPSRRETLRAFIIKICVSASWVIQVVWLTILTGVLKELDRLGATIQRGIVNFQPIHSQDEVYGGRLQEDGGSKELNSLNFNGGVWHYHGGSALTYRGPNNHRWVHRFILEVMRKCKCFRHE